MGLKKEYRKELETMQERLPQLQRELKAGGIPVVIVVEGWGTSGKGQLINNFILPLDPRGFVVYAIQNESEEEKKLPFLWRFITKTPEKGAIAIFDRSWYRRVLNDHIDKKVDKEKFTDDIEDINAFEKLLTDDGNLLIKLFLHISRDEQSKRIKELMSSGDTKWRVSKEDIKHNKQYEKYLSLSQTVMAQTGKANAQWHIIDANNPAAANLDIFSALISSFENRLNQPEPVFERAVIAETDANRLERVDLSLDIDKKDYIDRLEHYQKKLWRLHNIIYLNKIPVIALFEGWDAAGKGGAVMRLTSALDPRGYRVVSTPAPTAVEKAHHYLWRFWNNIPQAGHIAIFDRSWYGRLMVEPIEGFCGQNEYERAFSEINEMEKHLTGSGIILIKFFIHISPEEQLARFNERKEDPNKNWKLTDEDYRNREKWPVYTAAIEKMFERTDTPYAPWNVISGNSKKHARIEILRIVTEKISKELEKRPAKQAFRKIK